MTLKVIWMCHKEILLFGIFKSYVKLQHFVLFCVVYVECEFVNNSRVKIF